MKKDMIYVGLSVDEDQSGLQLGTKTKKKNDKK